MKGDRERRLTRLGTRMRKILEMKKQRKIEEIKENQLIGRHSQGRLLKRSTKSSQEMILPERRRS